MINSIHITILLFAIAFCIAIWYRLEKNYSLLDTILIFLIVLFIIFAIIIVPILMAGIISTIFGI